MGFYIHLITTKVLHSYFTFPRRTFKKKLGFYLYFEKRARLSPKTAIFMRPKWLNLAKRELYDIKLQNHKRLLTKNYMIWMIDSSIFKILEPKHKLEDILYFGRSLVTSVIADHLSRPPSGLVT